MNWKTLLDSQRMRPMPTRSASADMRTEYEKDYHRIIGSASFRRLQDKTQVFPLDHSDFIRTRLTHSLEVSSFCKSLGQTVSKRIMRDQLDPEFLPEYQGYLCDILQCAGLLHDIGNPPFGHFGETAIREWFLENLPRITYQCQDGTEQTVAALLKPQMLEDFYHFEGNTQALRLVTKLHYLVDANGMNLTKALLGTIIKYPGSSLEIGKDSHVCHKKMGYFYGDREIYQNLQESLGTNGNRHPLAFLLEAADDIAYRTADIEDAVKKGCISYHQLLKELRDYGVSMAEQGDWPQQADYDRLVDTLEQKYQRARQRELQQAEINAVQNWCVYVQGWLLQDVTNTFAEHYQEIMDGSYGAHGEDLLTGNAGGYMAKALGKIAYQYAFISYPILKLEIAAQSIFNFLLDKFVDAALYYGTDHKMTAVQEKVMALVSDNYKAVYRHFAQGKDEAEQLYLRLLLVTDTVCGMTDSYAKRLYQELNGII